MGMRFGMNLDHALYYNTSLPFLNVMKSGTGWYTYNNTTLTDEETSLTLDSDYWPTSVSFGTTNRVGMGLCAATGVSPYYPGGKYVVVYSGCTLAYTGDAVKNSGESSAGRDILDVTATNTGFRVYITAITGTPRISYIVHEDHEDLILAGEIFHPDFLEMMEPFRVIRNLDIDSIVLSPPVTWATRAIQAQPTWGGVEDRQTYASGVKIPVGVPIEVLVALCNKLRADLWYCTNVNHDDEFELNAATLIRATLDRRLRVYRESWNEQWNSGAGGASGAEQTARTLGAPFFPTGSGYQRGFNYHILRTVLGGNIWRGVFGAKGTRDGDRYFTVLGTQAANPTLTQNQLSYKCDGSFSGNNIPADQEYFIGKAALYIDAVASAPYFFSESELPEVWGKDVTSGTNNAFTELLDGGLIPVTTGAPTTSGTSTAYTVTTGLSLSDPPSDGQFIAVQLHTGNGSNPTLAADGGTAYPLRTRAGVNVANGAYGASALVFQFDADDESWIRSLHTGYAGGLLQRMLDRAAATKAIADGHDLGIKHFLYECGPHLVDFSNDQSAMQTLYQAINGDDRMYGALEEYFLGLEAAGVEVCCYFKVCGRQGSAGYWGAVDSVLTTRNLANTPKYEAAKDYAIASRTVAVSFGSAP